MLVLVGLAFALVISGCNDGTKLDSDKEIDVLMELEKPDMYFQGAVERFTEGNLTEAAELVDDAITFIDGLQIEGDLRYSEILDYLETELGQLRDDVADGNIDDVAKLYTTFASVDRSLATYHLRVVEEFYWLGGDSQEGLERLTRALIRIDHASQYQGFELSDEEKDEIQALKTALKDAERSNPALWKRTSAIIKKVNKSLKAHREQRIDAEEFQEH